MVTKCKIAIVFITLAVLAGCATTAVPQNQQEIYAEAQEAYISAWSTYHKLWSALPENDPRKIEWAQKYHPKFEQAGELLQLWADDTGSVEARINFDMVFDVLEAWLIDQMQKGGS
jgi:uncharacterized protein YceK